LVVLTVTVLAIVLAGSPRAATPRSGPSERACLITWNSTVNRSNHLRLLAQRPIIGLSLRAGVVGIDIWSKGAPPTQTSSQACLMTVSKRGEIRLVTGIWKNAGVSRWTFGRWSPTNTPFPSNVRLLPDGRVTKIYLR